MPKTWLITGASSGIGREISLAALSRGDTAIPASRTPETHLLQIASVVAEALRQHENIDILVNVAGYLLEGSVEETNGEQTEHLYKTNLFGPINLARALLPHFRARSALRGAAAAGNYCASKAALRVVTEALRVEVAAFGIEVCCVMLGHFKTNFLDQGHRLAVRGRVDEYEDVLGGIRRGFSAFHGRQPGDPVKAGNVIVGVLAGDGGAIGEVEGLKEVAGYTDLQGVGES
ncbi:hypothetical protein B9Z19DRAFT_1102316 [Tuber borchii]|uniref:NAD(P)-binding protein n=1 Tax=Tuber borchii TaxID=42251 RepID=A0A2T6ZM09_TUBBO|nr:hypothetical protein B9Z19DRAFT_1102316 [Tuber borchii]